MNRRFSKNFLVAVILGLLVFGIGESVSALTYQYGIGVSFTFNPALIVTVSADLKIDNLAPGTVSDSNIITVNVLTNSMYGYTLNATVGNDTTYDTRDLIHTNSQVTDKFTSVAYSATPTIASNTSLADNTWAYSYSVDNGTNWANYNGLPKYDDTTNFATLKSTNGPVSDASGDNIKFKIAARASANQPSGTYNNVINFIAVATPEPTPSPAPSAECNTPVPNLTYMQDLNSSNKATVLSSMTEDNQYYLRDKRDEKPYCVAKLKDGNIWMTQNLDHDIKTDGSVAYTPTTTDVPATWTPSTATYSTSTTTWNYSTTTPESYDPGTLYWNGNLWPTDQASCESAGGTWDTEWGYCDGFDLTSTTGSPHDYLGNYYNWTAAVAMNDSSSYTTDNQDANQSICPANWTLPKSGNVTTSGSFQYLVTQYGWDSSSQTMTNPNIWNSPIKASLSGTWDGSLGGVGGYGVFWSPMVNGSDDSYYLYADSTGTVYPDRANLRGDGISVRCLAR